MSQDNPSIMSHVSIGTNRFAEAATFYDAVLATIGARRILDFPNAIAYGKAFPEFWVQTPYDGQRAAVGNGTHFGFFASNRAQVDSFYAAALAQGASGDGAPGAREEYGEPYYGCFVRDLDGHKIEAAYWDAELAEQLDL
ncbi:VOC family protein [Chitinolyticbacter meiyuanensis]|uniref:VOC family protein n=1 Tax=Chitinolyticbacter meiyuanensis TaxID=682798 RepID=UPI0011E5B9A1|nr:VOC family protein [Chitinolyticbacter meiyuanensis]